MAPKPKVTGKTMPTNVEQGKTLTLIVQFRDGNGNIVRPANAIATLAYRYNGVPIQAVVNLVPSGTSWTGDWNSRYADVGQVNWSVTSSLSPATSKMDPFNVLAAQPDVSEPTTYGLWDYHCIGSMDAGSNILRLNSSSAFKVGQPVIVAVGGESGGGARGTVGVGGIIPAVDGTANYYQQMNAPTALVTTITAVSADGSVLTLNDPAVVATTNATIYFDNKSILYSVLTEFHPPGWIVTFGAGRFAYSSPIPHNGLPGWIITGAGSNSTVFFSPSGVKRGGFDAFQSDNTTYKNFGIEGNVGDNKFGWENDPSQSPFGYGILFTLCKGGIAENISCKNIFIKAVWGQMCENIQINNCDCTLVPPMRTYLANWYFGVSDSGPSVINNCKVTSTYGVGGFEMFRSAGTVFNGCSGQNAFYSSNSSGGHFQFNNCSMTMTAGYLNISPLAASPYVPIMDINSNIQPPDSLMNEGGTISNVNFVIQGYANSNNDLPVGVKVREFNPNIVVDGGLVDYQVNWSAPSILDGPVGAYAEADNTNVSNLTVKGGTRPSGASNITVFNGSVTHCTAETIYCNLPNCVLTP